jgi:hypothetical protein
MNHQGPDRRSDAALYGVVTFAVLALAFMATLHLVLGWPMVPSPTGRMHGSLLLGWYVVAGLFARAVGAHGARGASLTQAWLAGLEDIGRTVKGWFIR